MARPNIVLIHCHDLGRYLGCYDAPVETPRIDAFADSGVRFDRHFVTAPQCSPSRASLMTGKHPHEVGMLGLAHDEWELGPEQDVLPQYLSEAGYETHLFGLQHLTTDPDRLGYDHVHSAETLSADVDPSVHEQARARDVSETVSRTLDGGEYDAPFFASVGFFELHRVKGDYDFDFQPERYGAPDPDIVNPLPFLPDRPGIRSDIAGMHGMVSAIDDGVGTILDALEDRGLTGETMVVFTTEHGLAFPRAKGTCFDPGIEAALLVRYPDSGGESSVSDALLSNVDVFATILDVADVPVPDDGAGRPFTPLLTDRIRHGKQRGDRATTSGGNRAESPSVDTGEYEPRDHIFAGMTWHDRYNPIRAIRTDRWKYIRSFWRLPRITMTTDVYGSDAGQELQNEYYREQRPYEELYDLEADPYERDNLADDQDYQAVKARLREQLQHWMTETDDPLLDGPVLPDDFEEIQPDVVGTTDRT